MIDKNLNKEINNYLKTVKSFIICDWKTRRKFIHDLKNDIFDYMENNSVNNIEDVYKHFGTPRDIAKAFFEDADIKEIKRKMNISRILIIGIICALLIWAVGVTISIIDGHISNTGYMVEEIEDGFPAEGIIAESVGNDTE
ncbi:MAG: DUF6120 family protein [Clostridium sp.]|nr:DUF6120 family protein [Clostridium sp.]